MTMHALASEEEIERQGGRVFTCRCTCGQSFSFPFKVGLTPRRSARGALRRHIKGMQQ